VLMLVTDETLDGLRERARKKREEAMQQEPPEVPDVQLDDRVAYVEDDDPFRLEDGLSTSARVNAKFSWVSALFVCQADRLTVL
jgi:hypothetical protein